MKLSTWPLRFLIFFLALANSLGNARAEVPPLMKEELDKEAHVIVTGTVTGIRASWPTIRNHGLDYDYDLTIRVDCVEKGDIAEGTT